MTYSLTRRQGIEERRVQNLEADTAVHLLRDWCIAFPTEHLTIRDNQGSVVAYRLPHAAAAAR